MKANEFVRVFGLDEAVNLISVTTDDCFDGFELELNRIIESHDYIESLGGYQFVKDNLPFGYFGDGDYKDLIQKCLEDLESCKWKDYTN